MDSVSLKTLKILPKSFSKTLSPKATWFESNIALISPKVTRHLVQKAEPIGSRICIFSKLHCPRALFFQKFENFAIFVSQATSDGRWAPQTEAFKGVLQHYNAQTILAVYWGPFSATIWHNSLPKALSLASSETNTGGHLPCGCILVKELLTKPAKFR